MYQHVGPEDDDTYWVLVYNKLWDFSILWQLHFLLYQLF